jgi:hypothetical protein
MVEISPQKHITYNSEDQMNNLKRITFLPFIKFYVLK